MISATPAAVQSSQKGNWPSQDAKNARQRLCQQRARECGQPPGWAGTEKSAVKDKRGEEGAAPTNV